MAVAIALVDCDNFFVSCERLFRPELLNKPVLILSSNDGCVISRSNEVKQLGVKMGVPYFQVRELCTKNAVTIFSSNFELYRDMSDRVMSVLKRFSEQLEVYSIDEAFLTLHISEDSNAEQIFARKGKQIHESVLRETGIPVSIGMSHTKTLAKCASYLAKPRHGGKGYKAIVDGASIIETLKHIPVDDVWGIGKRLAIRLEKYNIHTAYDLSVAHDHWLRKEIHLPGVRTAQELRGTSHFNVTADTSIRKSLLHSHSFGAPVKDFTALHGAMLSHVRSAVEILRKEHIVARRVSVVAYTRYHNARIPFSAYTEILPTHSNDTLLIAEVVTKILKRVYQPHVEYKKAGVLFTDIAPMGAQSRMTLFQEDTNKNSELMHALDTLRSRFGDVVKIGGELEKKDWKARREHLSPRYTTRWGEVVKI